MLPWPHEPFPCRTYRPVLPPRRRSRAASARRVVRARGGRDLRPRGPLGCGEVNAFARMRAHDGARLRRTLPGRAALLGLQARRVAPPGVPCAAAGVARGGHGARQPGASVEAQGERRHAASCRRRARAPAGCGRAFRRGPFPRRVAAFWRPGRARSNATRPRVLLLDEVDAALDDDSALAVGRLTRSLVDERVTCLRIRHRASDGFASGTFTLADGALSFAATGGEGVRP